MFWLGLLLPVCFVGGITGVSIPTQWAVLSVALPFGLWRHGRMTVVHWLGALFLVYALARAPWAVNGLDAVTMLWLLTLWALSFWLGSTLDSLLWLFRGLALGLTVSTAVAIGQYFGYDPTTITLRGNLAGLLYNQTVQAAMIALTIVGLVCYRQWFYIPALLPGLYLANSRGGWLILGVGLCARYVNLKLCLAALASVAIWYNFHADLSDSYRLQTWAIAAKNITLWGWGPGSFHSVMFWTKGTPTQIHPEFVHNDYVQLLFEYGAGASFILFGMALLLFQRHVREWPVYIAFLALATFYFPLYHALIAFTGLICAGRIARDSDWSRLREYLWGPPILPGSYHARLLIDRGGSTRFPL